MATSKSMHAVMLGVLAVSGMLLAGTVSATPVLVTSRSALGGTDFIDWADAGASFTQVTNPFAINSNGGLNVNVSKPSPGPFERRDEGNGWAGNFAPGDALMWTNDTAGPMSLSFSSLVFGGGAQIQQDSYGAFTAVISAYDSGGNLLASFTLAGNGTSGEDNSAIFIGILDTVADISRIEIGMFQSDEDFAINQFDLVGFATGVPEPGVLGMFGAGLAGIILLILVRRSRFAGCDRT